MTTLSSLENEGKVKLWARILCLLVFGLIFVISSVLTTNAFFNSIFSNLASAIIIAGIFSALNETLLQDNLVDQILTRIELKKEIDRTGIVDVLTDISDIDYCYYFHNAKSRIDIVHVYGRTWTSTYQEDIQDKLLRSNCKVRVFLVDPESPYINGLASSYGITVENLRKRIYEAAEVWYGLQGKVKTKQQNRRATNSSLEIFYHKGQPSNSIYRIDDQIIVVMNRIPDMDKTRKLTAIVCKNTKTNSDLYSSYIEELDALELQSKTAYRPNELVKCSMEYLQWKEKEYE